MFFTWKNGITDYSNKQLLLSQNSELSNLMMCCDLMFENLSNLKGSKHLDVDIDLG